MSTLICHKKQRREHVRQHRELNGIDYLEVSKDQHTLTVYFLGKAPVEVKIENLRIEGGRRIQNIRVTKVQLHHFKQIEFDDYMEIQVDKPGDFSKYTLRIIEQNAEGKWQPHSDFDPRYDHVAFSFKVDCPSDLDCKQAVICPQDSIDEPDINYLAKDYASFRQLILDRLALVMPEWNERHVPDIGIALVEVLAYAGDHLSYYQDAVATEAYLDTARKRVSIRRHARLVDYQMHEGCNARTWICIETESDCTLLAGDFYFTSNLSAELPNSTSVLSTHELQKISPRAYEVFEPMVQQDVPLYRDHSEIRFYTWGDKECCLPRGTTNATLIGELITQQTEDEEDTCDTTDGKEPVNISLQEITTTESINTDTIKTITPRLHLKSGDVIIFMEIVGPATDHPGDADPGHRHAVRLTTVKAAIDPLNQQPVVEISWEQEDALPFPLCISTLGPPPHCDILQDISIACANVILVDHGKTVDEDLGEVTLKETLECCTAPGVLADTTNIIVNYSPALKYAPLTYSETFVKNTPASHVLKQDVRNTLPQLLLNATHPITGSTMWSPQQDLLGSNADDKHVVVETDNDGHTRLRFGNGEMGQQPKAGNTFHSTYRIGNGTAGNLGLDVISHLVLRKTQLSGCVTNVRNPLVACGGTAPETIAEVKQFAPHAFRKKLQRAIIADDYATLVEREFKNKVQRAAAQLRWMGSWYEMLVAIDPYGEEEADAELLNKITQRLYRYRRIGHDLVVKSARRVPLDIEISVCVLPDYLRGHVKAELLDKLSNRQLINGQYGFFHVDRLTFGDDIYLSQLVAAAQMTKGVESIQLTKFQRLNELANQEIEKGVLPLGPFEIARLDNDPGFPENGKLTLNMRGGR